MISIFGIRPIELTTVFESPKHYSHICYISESSYDENDKKTKRDLSPDLRKCLWYDCIGRHVLLPRSALEEVVLLSEQNLKDQTDTQRLRNFPINETILEMI